jgi:hypothetical protein
MAQIRNIRRLSVHKRMEIYAVSEHLIVMHCQVRIELTRQPWKEPLGRGVELAGLTSCLDDKAAQVAGRVFHNFPQAPSGTGHYKGSARQFWDAHREQHALRL